MLAPIGAAFTTTVVLAVVEQPFNAMVTVYWPALALPALAMLWLGPLAV